MSKHITVQSFWQPYIASGFSCSACRKIIDMDSPGHSRTCDDCKARTFTDLYKPGQSKYKNKLQGDK